MSDDLESHAADSILRRLQPEAGDATRAILITRLYRRMAGVDNLSSRFTGWLAAKTGLHPKKVQRALARGQRIHPKVLRAVQHRIPRHGQGALLDSLRKERLAPAAAIERVRRWRANPDPEPLPIPHGNEFSLPQRGVYLLCADSINAVPLIDGAFGCIIGDVPYGIGLPIANDERPHLDFIPPMAERLAPGRALVLFCSESTMLPWATALTESELSIHEIIRWEKLQGGYKRAVEIVLVASKGPLQVFNDDRTSVYEYRPVSRAERDHKAAKPVAMMERLIERYSRPGEMVLDPFFGTAPVAEAAIRTERRYYGVELDPSNYEKARARLKRAVREATLRQAKQLLASAA